MSSGGIDQTEWPEGVARVLGDVANATPLEVMVEVDPATTATAPDRLSPTTRDEARRIGHGYNFTPHDSDRARWRRMRQIKRGQLTGPVVTEDARRVAEDLLGEAPLVALTDTDHLR